MALEGLGHKVSATRISQLLERLGYRRQAKPSAVVALIAATTTGKGVTVRCELDANTYEKGVKVSDAEIAALNIEGDPFHPEWS